MADEATGNSYSKDQIRIVGSKVEEGMNKRVFKVEIDGPDGPKSAMLKIPRVFVLGSTRRLSEEEIGQIDIEAQDLRKLKMIIPAHIPGYIGKYESANKKGILVDTVDGGIVASKEGVIQNQPTREQWDRFNNSVLTLIDQGVVLDLDTILLDNLILGKLPDSDQVEVILIEPKIIGGDQANKDIQKQWVLGGLKSDFNKLFPQENSK